MTQDQERRSDLPVDELDDERDGDELRDRYEGLLQELRVLLPGVQLLAAFLFTVPFAQQFTRVDDVGRAMFGAALFGAVLSVITFIAPIALHRFGSRTARVRRLRISIMCARTGLFLMGVAMMVAQAVVSRFLFNTAITVALVSVTSLAMFGMWIGLPLGTRGATHGSSGG